MRVATTIVRMLLGLSFLVFGLNYFFNFFPLPPLPPRAKAFIGVLVNSGYLMTANKIVEVTCGALLLTGVFVPLALILLGPTLVNILLFHVFLTPPADWILAVVLVVVWLFLLWRYRDYYKPLFSPRSTQSS